MTTAIVMARRSSPFGEGVRDLQTDHGESEHPRQTAQEAGQPSATVSVRMRTGVDADAHEG